MRESDPSGGINLNAEPILKVTNVVITTHSIHPRVTSTMLRHPLRRQLCPPQPQAVRHTGTAAVAICWAHYEDKRVGRLVIPGAAGGRVPGAPRPGLS